METQSQLDWLQGHYAGMPPVAALQLSPPRLQSDRLCLHAPLAANVNDKGCAFGGSLVSLMTLAGWGLVTLRLREAGLAADVFVADSSVRYRVPLYADLEAESWLAEAQMWASIAAQVRDTGRASANVSARVLLPDGGDAVRCLSRFVAVAKG